MRARDMGVVGGDGSETGSVMEGEEKKVKDQYRCQPHPELEGQREEQRQQVTFS